MLKLFQKTSKLISNTSYYLFCKDQTSKQNNQIKLTQNYSNSHSQQQRSSIVSSYDDDDQFHKDNDFLASQILKEILSTNSPGDQINCLTETNLSSNNIKQGSLKKQFVPLRQRILNKIELSSVNQRSKTQLLNIFTKGVPINKKIWNHKRITQGCIRQNDGQQICMFCPTDIVTGPIFRRIFQTMNKSTQKCQTQTLLLSGFYGISKKFSLLLYSILSSYIIKYQFKKLSKPLVQGISKQLFKVPKLIYLSLEKPMYQQRNTQQKMENLIKLQCEELYKNIGGLSQSEKIYGINQIKQFYNKYDYPILLVIDQINIVASIFGRKRFIEQQIKRNNYEDDFQKNSLIDSFEKISKQYKQAWKIIEFFGKSYTGFNLLIYLSSLTFQMQFQTEINLSGDERHTNAHFKKFLNYSQEFSKNKIKYEITDYFIFEFSQRFLRNTIHKDFIASLQPNDIKLKHQIRSKMVQIINQDPTYFTTPHLIRRYFQKLQLQQHQIIQKLTLNKVNLSNHLVQIFKKTCRNNKEYLKLELYKVCIKLDCPQGNLLIIKLYAAALQKYEQISNSKYNNYLEIKLQEENWQGMIMKIDSPIFSFDLETKMFKIMLPLQLIIEVLRVQLFEIVKILYISKNLQFYFRPLPRGVLRIIYEYHFLAILRSYNAKIIGQIKSSDHFVEISYKYLKIYSKLLGFNAMPEVNSKKNSEKYTLLKQLRPYFEILDSQNITTEQTFLVLPCNIVKTNQYQNILQNGLQRYLHNESIKHNQESKHIDFLTFRFSQKTRNIQVQAYYLTIGKNDIFERMKNIVNQFSQQAKYDQHLMKINKNQYTVKLSISITGPKLVDFKWTPNQLKNLQENSNSMFKFENDIKNPKILNVSKSKELLLTKIEVIDTISQLIPSFKQSLKIHEGTVNWMAGFVYQQRVLKQNRQFSQKIQD